MNDTKDKKNYATQDQFLLERDFLSNPLMTGIKLSRYKFVAKMISKKDVVLDLGCGNGYSSYFFSKFCSKVVGVDLYADIDRCRQRFGNTAAPHLEFLASDILEPSPEVLDHSFTAVTLIDVIEHFYKEDGEKILSLYSEQLPPGGVMIIGTPSRFSQPYRSQQSNDVHFHEYEPDELKEICDRYFQRTFLFSMNDEVVHTGFNKLAWFFYILACK